jgi:hypothetical protein
VHEKKEVNMTEIVRNLYIGNIQTAANYEWLKAHNIKLIVNCTGNIPNYFAGDIKGLKYIKLELNDDLQEKIKDACLFSYGYINKTLERGNSVLIHCRAGISRSSTILIYYLLRKNNAGLSDVWTYIKKIYPKAKPNINYRHQLRELCQGMSHQKKDYDICWIV